MIRLGLLVLWPLCLAGAALALIWMPLAALAGSARAWRIAVSFDQLFNTTAGGSEDETVSSRAAKAKRAGRRWGCILCRLLDRIDPGHCERNLEPDEGDPA